MGWGRPQLEHLVKYQILVHGIIANMLFSEKLYGFKTNTAADRHIDQLRVLSSLVPLWPPVDEMLAASRKAKEVVLLDKIANEVTHTIRPTTVVITQELTHAPIGVVFKREVSDTGTHVLLPDKVAALSKKELRSIALDRFTWMSQTYIPQLRQFGEWRVYFIGGKFYDVVITNPDGDRHIAYLWDEIWSLEELRWVI